MSPVSSGGVASPGKNTKKVASCWGLERSICKAPAPPGTPFFLPVSCLPAAWPTCTATREEGESALAARRKKPEPHLPPLSLNATACSRAGLPVGAGARRRRGEGGGTTTQPPSAAEALQSHRGFPPPPSSRESVVPTGCSTHTPSHHIPG